MNERDDNNYIDIENEYIRDYVYFSNPIKRRIDDELVLDLTRYDNLTDSNWMIEEDCVL